MPVELELSTLCCGETITTNQANYESDPRGVFLGETQNVGSYPPNPWGLYDTHDSVWEWCADV
jgi:eukaryotic-like serine/threonine-protein kinase